MVSLNSIIYFMSFIHLDKWGVYAGMLIILFVYRKFRTKKWRRILKNSIEYHKFHLASISNDSSADARSRELAHSLLWGIAKQLPADLKEGRGSRALYNSFTSRKTALNTCGTVFYECVNDRNSKNMTIFKLDNTLISTLYRAYLLESVFSILGLLFYDISLLKNKIIKSQSGNGKFYVEMSRETGREI